MLRLELFALLLTVSASPHAQQARGVNPADIDSRFDVIVEHIALDPESSTRSLTFKYDYKLGPQWGLNFVLPAYTRLSVPGATVTGYGELFARVRWIVPAGAWTYGASFETVLPVAREDALGTGRYQLNVGGLVVRMFSPSFLSAAVIRQTTSVGGDSARPSFSNTEFRFVPVFILPHG